ncbi:MAG: nitronate monooxygenase family protein [Lachnospiraceae bacterium]|jgi:enoyl-[acyl-carrier protein] reductase II|nr:nitronate monooxygenase family protein [Lachnospiraceae bacterium]
MGNKVCETLGIEYPVISGAMAWTSMAPLVGAVSAAGGLGTLGSGFMPKEIILGQMDAVRKMTDKPFAANLFLDPSPMLEVGVSAILEGKPAVAYIDSLNLLQYDFTKEYYDKFHEAGIKVVAKINYLEDALVAAKAGADVIITKGFEGGGHVTKVSARVLLAEVVEANLGIPIVASGGIATPRQAAGLTVQGADGIEMGTAFMATQECPIHPNCKQAIVDAIDRDIVACGQSTGEPSWQITNPLAQEMLKIEADLPWDEAKAKIQEMSMGSLRAAAMEGDREKGAVLAGQVVGLIHDIPPVADRIVKFCDEWAELLKKDYSLF